METGAGIELSPAEAATVFEAMPAQWRLASLDPAMVAIDALRDATLAPVHWCFRQGGEQMLRSFHVGTDAGSGVCDIQSAYGYGGPLSTTDDPRFVDAAAAAFDRWARQRGVVAEFLRFHPLVPHARWYKGTVTDNRDTVHLDLGRTLFGQYKVRRRTDVRRFLESGLVAESVSPQAMLESFPAIYGANMERIGAAASYLFPDGYFRALFHFARADNWLVRQGETAVAGAVVLASSAAGVAEYHLGANLPGLERQKAMIGLLHAIATRYQTLSYRLLYLGGGRTAAADDSLLFFKRGFSDAGNRYVTGACVHDRQRYSQLAVEMPEKAARGRVLFYRD